MRGFEARTFRLLVTAALALLLAAPAAFAAPASGHGRIDLAFHPDGVDLRANGTAPAPLDQDVSVPLPDAVDKTPPSSAVPRGEWSLVYAEYHVYANGAAIVANEVWRAAADTVNAAWAEAASAVSEAWRQLPI